MNCKLFNRYPGAKDPRKYQFWDGDRYDAVIEPFAGSGIFSLFMMSKGVQNLFFADTDPTVRAVYKTWLDKGCHSEFYNQISSILIYLGGGAPVSQVWADLLNKFYSRDDRDYATLAAVSLVIRDLTFGGVIRFNSQGVMNQPWVLDRVDWLKRQSVKRYQLPPIPKSGFIGHSCWQSFQSFRNSECRSAICLIDPPYYSPSCKDASYQGHDGRDTATLDLCIEAVRKAIEIPQIKRIIVCNYYTEELAEALRNVCGDRVSSQHLTGTLTRMQRGKVCTTKNQECIWEIGQPAMQQLSLLG